MFKLLHKECQNVEMDGLQRTVVSCRNFTKFSYTFNFKWATRKHRIKET